MPQIQLPVAFRDLASYHEWSLATEGQRSAKRQASTIEDLRSFYAGIMPRMEAVLDFLARLPLQADAEVQALLHIALSLAEIAPAVENYGQPSVIDGYDVARFVAVHE